MLYSKFHIYNAGAQWGSVDKTISLVLNYYSDHKYSDNPHGLLEPDSMGKCAGRIRHAITVMSRPSIFYSLTALID